MQLPRAPYRAGNQESQQYEEMLPLVTDFTRVRINDDVAQARSQYERLVIAA